MRNRYFHQSSETTKENRITNVGRRRFLRKSVHFALITSAASAIEGVTGLFYLSYAKGHSLSKIAYPSVESIPKSFSYNGAAAAAYADYWAISNYVHVDLSHSGTLEPHGEDCTNFVSNCLLAGGMPMTSMWYSKWDYGIWWEHTNSWTVVPNLYNYLIPNGLAVLNKVIYPYEPVGNNTGLVPGDLIFVDWGDGAGMSHVVIQTNPKLGADCIDSHTEDRKGLDWQLHPINKKNLTTTFYLVHIVSNTASD